MPKGRLKFDFQTAFFMDSDIAGLSGKNSTDGGHQIAVRLAGMEVCAGRHNG
ncbi:hypothetical protein [Neisseria sp. CCUG12390]|uniref:hypothetical protein n=1 Tax=Neisseria sp. CCUG12390 TaxID=3392035 RepID=UPI003A0FD9A4